MKTAAIILIITILTAVTAFSQVNIECSTGFSSDLFSGNAMCMVTDASGNVYQTGTRCSVNDNRIDIVTVKYNSLGFMQWINTYNGFSGSVEAGLTVQIDSSSNIIVTGKSKTSGKVNNTVNIKYNSGGAMLEITDGRNLTSASGSTSSVENTGKFELEQNYPDPFSSIVNIKYTVPSDLGKNPTVKLTVYDFNGNMIHTLLVQNEKPGSHETSFDRSGLKAGMYFCRMEYAHYSSTKKLILMN